MPILRRHLPPLAKFCAADGRFSLLVSLDGTDAEVSAFCQEWRVPLLYSDAREGVGLSKNRALAAFPDFDYYFFLEDDVELVEGAVFPTHVELSRQTGIHHFSLFVRDGIRKPTGESVIGDRRVAHCLYGGADFNFFTREGLERVGGWHPRFAAFRRFGHTEHSYRFPRAGLAPAPFNVVTDLIDSCIWHVPPAVTHVDGMEYDDDQIALPERELMERELAFVPVETMSTAHFNGVDIRRRPRELAATLDGEQRYPLAQGHERRHAEAEYLLWKSSVETGARRVTAFAQAVLKWPSSPALRHRVKTTLAEWRTDRQAT